MMIDALIGEIERLTQNRIIRLFREELGYHYLGNLEDRFNNNIEDELLRDYLINKAGYPEDHGQRRNPGKDLKIIFGCLDAAVAHGFTDVGDRSFGPNEVG